MGLFSDIYNTVAKFFRPQEETGEEASKSVATNRLKLVLMQDRTNLTPRILEQMRSELIDLLSRYVELDKELLELNFEQEGDQVALMLSIPVIRAKDEEEIDAAIKAHQEMLDKIEESTDSDNSESSDDESDEISDSNEEISENSDDADSENGEIVSEEETEKKPKRTRKKDADSSVSTPEEMSNSSPVNEEQSQEVSEGI